VATPGWGHETARHWRIRHRNGSRVIELEEILLPYFATAISARHGGELRGAFQTYCNVAEFGEDLKVASRAAAKIEYSERPFTGTVAGAARLLNVCRHPASVAL